MARIVLLLLVVGSPQLVGVKPKAIEVDRASYDEDVELSGLLVLVNDEDETCRACELRNPEWRAKCLSGKQPSQAKEDPVDSTPVPQNIIVLERHGPAWNEHMYSFVASKRCVNCMRAIVPPARRTVQVRVDNFSPREINLDPTDGPQCFQVLELGKAPGTRK